MASKGFDKLDTGLVVVDGRHYVDGHGDVKGPMHKCAGFWLDQHGALFHDNGIQWNHIPSSAGNLRSALSERGGA